VVAVAAAAAADVGTGVFCGAAGWAEGVVDAAAGVPTGADVGVGREGVSLSGSSSPASAAATAASMTALVEACEGPAVAGVLRKVDADGGVPAATFRRGSFSRAGVASAVAAGAASAALSAVASSSSPPPSLAAAGGASVGVAAAGGGEDCSASSTADVSSGSASLGGGDAALSSIDADAMAVQCPTRVTSLRRARGRNAEYSRRRPSRKRDKIR
jgi:hypothetical protein